MKGVPHGGGRPHAQAWSTSRTSAKDIMASQI